MSNNDQNYLFVYGTLKQGHDNPLKQLFNLKTDFIENCSINGELFLVDYYPGLVLTPKNVKVHGELYRIKDPDLLKELDLYEGCHPQSPKPHIYQRVKIPLQSSRGSLNVWVYEFIAATEHLQKIKSGRF